MQCHKSGMHKYNATVDGGSVVDDEQWTVVYGWSVVDGRLQTAIMQKMDSDEQWIECSEKRTVMSGRWCTV